MKKIETFLVGLVLILASVLVGMYFYAWLTYSLTMLTTHLSIAGGITLCYWLGSIYINALEVEESANK